MVTVCLQKTTKSLRTEFAAVEVGQSVKDRLTSNKGQFRSFRVRTRRPVTSVEDGKDLEPKQKLNHVVTSHAKCVKQRLFL